MLIALNYHYIRPTFDAPYPSIFGVTPEQFENQLELLSRVGVFVGAQEIREAIERGLDLPERAIAITLDDGLQEQFSHAWPVLQKMGIPAIFFVNTAAIAEHRVLGVHKIHLVRANRAPAELVVLIQEQAASRELQLEAGPMRQKALHHYNYDEPEVACLKYMLNFILSPADRDLLIADLFEEIFAGEETSLSEHLYLTPHQIRALGQNGCIGSHSHDHLPLGLISHAEAEQQLISSLQHLTEWVGQSPYALSYPYGSYEACAPHVGEIAGRLGVKFAFTVERAGNRDLQKPLHLARCDCNDLPGGKSPQWDLDHLFSQIPNRNWYLQ